MAGKYWVRGPQGTQGPFDQLQVRGLVATGQLTPSMEISQDQARWLVANNVKGLFPAPVALTPAIAAAPPPLPPTGQIPTQPPPLPQHPINAAPASNLDTFGSNSSIAQQSPSAVTPQWQQIFGLIDKAGGANLPPWKTLPAWKSLAPDERRLVSINY